MYVKYLNLSGSMPSGAGSVALTPKTITAIRIVEIARYNVCTLCHIMFFCFGSAKIGN